MQRTHEQRNTLTGHLQIHESIYGIKTHRTEIQTPKTTTSVDVYTTVVSFSPTAYMKEFTQKRKTMSRNLNNRVLNDYMLIAL
jgi:hypothetical protein